ncbi:MAG: ribonucleoside triphosphate reductase [bacterium]|nr:ribonucleoside triphosphate reductase [bacterium]
MPQEKSAVFKTIIKRDGSLVAFNKKKITVAIAKAGKATGEFDEKEAKSLTEKTLILLGRTRQTDVPSVEETQDAVERTLMASKHKKTAKAFIVYRAQHAEMRALTISASLGLVDNYIGSLDWQVKENSNMGYSLQGLNNYIFSETSKTYWLNKIYPKEVREAYERGDMHIHDLGTLSVYCVGWDLMDLLTEGFRGVPGKIESAPAKHLRTALGQIVNFMYTLQGEAAGAIAFSNLDTLLAPFIRYDKLTEKEVRQCLQEFVFNMNVPTRVGFQTPFSNVTLDLTPSPNFKDQNVIIGGKTQKETYGEFQHEMDVFNHAFFSVLGEGDAAGRVFTFPIPTVNVTRDFDWDNPKLKGLWDITAKYGIPYFSNFLNSDMKPEDTRSMCCRLRLDLDELDRRGGGLFGANALTGSIGVVTINLPRIGYLAKSEREFFDQLDRQMDIAKESLEIKRKVIERLARANLYPYTSFYLRKIYDAYGEYWKNHFSTIGLIGTNEAVQNFLGTNIGTDKGRKFAEKVLIHMREKLIKYQHETGNLYNLEATPAEGTAYRLALNDKKHYPDIIVANEAEVAHGAEPFYTNSSHLPVNYTDDIFEALSIQDSLQTKYTGGTVVHLFLGERITDSSSVPRLVKKVCENFKLPYFTLTPTFSVCASHGYLSGEHRSCPTCSGECEVYSRVVGYLRPVGAWNEGKQAEWSVRKTYIPLAENGKRLLKSTTNPARAQV